jgi:hypothetical protein
MGGQFPDAKKPKEVPAVKKPDVFTLKALV